MIDELKQIETRARKELAAIEDEESLERWRVVYLGRKGSLTLLLRSLTSLPLEERRSTGAIANRLKSGLEEALAARREEVEGAGEAAEAREALADRRLLHQAEAGLQGPCVEL